MPCLIDLMEACSQDLPNGQNQTADANCSQISKMKLKVLMNSDVKDQFPIKIKRISRDGYVDKSWVRFFLFISRPG